MLSLTHPMLGLVVGEGTTYAFFDTSHVMLIVAVGTAFVEILLSKMKMVIVRLCSAWN